jgi:hypothetical protein
MKKIFYMAVLTGLCGFPVFADEQPLVTKTSSSGDSPDSYVGKLGAGVIVGEPTGGSLKYWLNDTLAIDGAVGWSSHDNTDLYLHGDVLWHNFDLIPVAQGRLPVYLGVGGLMRFRGDNQDNQAGVRVPVGLSYMFDRVPVDIFVEIAPAIDFTPDVRGDLTGGAGIRFWF